MNILFVRVILLIYCIYAPASLAKTRHLNVESEHVSIQNLPGQAHDHHYKLGSTDMEEIEQKFDAKLIGRFQLDLLQVNKLADVLDDPSNQDYRFFFIRFLNEKGFKYLEVFDFLDRVLTPRVWMSLRFFVTEKKTGLQKHFVIPEDTLLEYIIIEHLPKTADIAARIIAKQNYPSASECEKRPMITTNIIGDAWGNRMRNTMGVLRKKNIFF